MDSKETPKKGGKLSHVVKKTADWPWWIKYGLHLGFVPLVAVLIYVFSTPVLTDTPTIAAFAVFVLGALYIMLNVVGYQAASLNNREIPAGVGKRYAYGLVVCYTGLVIFLLAAFTEIF